MRHLPIALAWGCAGAGGPERPDAWFDGGEPLHVLEPVAFTDVPYDFTGPTPIGDVPTLLEGQTFATVFGLDHEPPACDDWLTTELLPAEVEGVVTLHPRFYFKTNGCVPASNPDVDSDEKYYGSYFVQDASGGVFVLGNSKVAHFDMGARVRLRVRAVKESFGLVSVAGHDVLEVARGPEPIYYDVPTGPLGNAHIGRVQRITGTVATPADTFGELQVEADDGTLYSVNLDAELGRRGVSYPVGQRITVTGPVLYSYGIYAIVVMRVGQIQEAS